MRSNIFRNTIILSAVLLVFSGVSYSQGQAAAIVAVDEGSGSAGTGAAERASSASFKGRQTSREAKSTARSKARSSSSTASRPRPAKAFNGAVLGDKYSFLNFEVISAEKPIYRRAAKQGGASGLVQVEILVDTDGSVLTAKARTGNKLLWDEAERAALASRLNRPVDNGRPARAMGFLVYRFGAAEVDDDN